MSSLDSCYEIEAQWLEAARTLERCEAAVREAMRAYRQHSPACGPSRVAQALAAQEEAKATLDALTRSIWAKLP